ncbi:MAG: hypothetical protein HeimC2_21680 [Candidatus Heimdallarchaeota archaeon LC_2]|nr:MAG: hypothetical protein HeimC2_21680 [Candidatus Heimdallarchaeota archaeon LC_2]
MSTQLPTKSYSNADLLRSVTKIKIQFTSSGLSPLSGTGFFMKYKDRKFVVTAAHVFGHFGNVYAAIQSKFLSKDPKISISSEKAMELTKLYYQMSDVRSKIDEIDLNDTDFVTKATHVEEEIIPIFEKLSKGINYEIGITIPITVNGDTSIDFFPLNPVLGSGLIFSPTGETVDLIVHDITSEYNKNRFRGLDINFLNIDDIISDETEVMLGDSMFMIGYPLGTHESYFWNPFALSGNLASDWDVPNDNRPIFYLNGLFYPGNSGSPVFIRVWDDELKALVPKLAGIYIQGTNKDGIPLPLGIVIYAAALKDQIHAFYS